MPARTVAGTMMMMTKSFNEEIPVKEPKRVQVKPSPKQEKPGRTPHAGPRRPQPYDNIDSADVPIDDETSEKGYTVIPE
jgi:hypothetical protein